MKVNSRIFLFIIVLVFIVLAVGSIIYYYWNYKDDQGDLTALVKLTTDKERIEYLRKSPVYNLISQEMEVLLQEYKRSSNYIYKTEILNIFLKHCHDNKEIFLICLNDYMSSVNKINGPILILFLDTLKRMIFYHSIWHADKENLLEYPDVLYEKSELFFNNIESSLDTLKRHYEDNNYDAVINILLNNIK